MPEKPSELARVVHRAAERIVRHRAALDDAPAFPAIEPARVREKLGGPMPFEPADASEVLEQLAAAVEPGLVASAGPRYFGFVIGGSLDSAVGAELLATGWDQNAFNAVTSPMAAVVEEIAGEWLKEVLGLPRSASFGFVTGGQAANTVALAAARHHVLAREGWDVERRGLASAPPIRVLASEERHVTLDRSLRFLGLGTDAVTPISAGRNGAMDAGALRAEVERADGPLVIAAQAGNVNTGACDDLAAICDAAQLPNRRSNAWVHVDGAFGLWAAASPSTRRLVAGLERADSWACDGHKWLNVPYDSGYVFCAHPASHRASMTFTAAYLVGPGGELRSPADYGPESSRRARGFATWAALRELGRGGVAELVDRCCRLARRFADRLAAETGAEIANEVVLNQVLASFGDDERTNRVLERVQRSGVCWMSGTTWRGRRFMRISVSSWRTSDADVERSVAAIREACASA
jgi:glutamate/tyrosine decarboxylase-like PLP-dependent enzyme